MSTTTKNAPVEDRINAKLDEVRDLLIESGVDEGTADAKLFAARPNQGSLLGNLADLQRLGGTMAPIEEGKIAEAFVVPDYATPEVV